MTMAIFRDESGEPYDFATFSPFAGNVSAAVSPSILPVLASKLQPPLTSGLMEREWLLGLMERSAKSSAATMLIGRAGTGKSALAAHFVKRFPEHSWYSIDSTDADWTTFQRYFRAALFPKGPHRKNRHSGNFEPTFSSTPVELFADLTAALELYEQRWPDVLILDGVHHLYDCRWFDEFFLYLISSLPHDAHVVLISRSKPTAPVWRMRSKQVLNVIDEKLLTFSLNETSELFSRHGLSRSVAARVHRETFGRPAEIMALLEASESV